VSVPVSVPVPVPVPVPVSAYPCRRAAVPPCRRSVRRAYARAAYPAGGVGASGGAARLAA
jgi:hypothetical protein